MPQLILRQKEECIKIMIKIIKKYYLYFVIVASTCIACDKRQKESTNTSQRLFYANGQVKEERIILNNCIEEGLSKSYYSNGQIKDSLFLKNNKPDRLSYEYTENGTIIAINNMSNGERVGSNYVFNNKGEYSVYCMYDFKGRLRYRVYYDSKLRPIKEEGELALIDNLEDEKDNIVKRGTYKKISLLVPTPPHLLVRLKYVKLDKNQKEISRQLLPIINNYSEVVIRFDTIGKYRWNFLYTIQDTVKDSKSRYTKIEEYETIVKD